MQGNYGFISSNCYDYGSKYWYYSYCSIVALSSFDIASYFVIFTFIGIFGAMLSKKEKIKTIFMTFAGLGLVFMALSMMSNSMSDFKNSETIVNMLASINNPFILFIIGIALTALLQSSSALTTIIISMASVGIAIGGRRKFCIIYNIG